MEVNTAIANLGNKAIGVDLLKDTTLKKVLTPEIVSKISDSYNCWIRKGNIPQYASTARVVALSKTGSPYPPKGQIRTISILPAITKIYEKAILARMTQSNSELTNFHKA
jgi:hypothetical protein